MCYEKVVTTGAGATEYMLSRANQNNPYPMTISDQDGSEVDGQPTGASFQPESVCCTVPF